MSFNLASFTDSKVLIPILVTTALGLAINWLYAEPKTLKHITTLPSIPFIWQTLRGKAFDEQYLSLRNVLEKEGCAKLWAFGNWMLIISDVEMAKTVCGNPDVFRKLLLEELMPGSTASKFFGTNLVISNDEIWKRHRKIANPAFSHIDVTSFDDSANELVKHIAKKSQNNGSIAVRALMAKVTLDILGKAAFGFNFRAVEDPNGHFVSLYESVIADLNKPFYAAFPFLDRYLRPASTLRKIEEIEKLVNGIIEEKKRQDVGEKNKDLLSRMIKANMSEGGNKLNDKELRDNMVMFLLAGHETTANALAALIYQFAVDKSIQARAREEVLQILGENFMTITLENQKRLEYLTACIKENLRLSPPIPVLPGRVSNKEFDLGGNIIPKNMIINLHIWGIHRSQKYWTNPDDFDPERFLKKDEVEAGTWLPFGLGVRMCLGLNFGLVEQKILMAHLLQAFEWELKPGSIHEKGLKYSSAGVGILSPLEIDVVFTSRT